MSPKANFPALFIFFLIGFPIFLAAEELQYDSGNRRDPFVPLIGPGGALLRGFNPSGLNVEGIIFDPKQGSLVLINGEFYKPGDQVQKAQIISIFKDRVVLSQNDEQKVLWLREELVNGGEKKDDQTSGADK